MIRRARILTDHHYAESQELGQEHRDDMIAGLKAATKKVRSHSVLEWLLLL